MKKDIPANGGLSHEARQALELSYYEAEQAERDLVTGKEIIISLFDRAIAKIQKSKQKNTAVRHPKRKKEK